MSAYGLSVQVWSELDAKQQQKVLARPTTDAGQRKQAVADIIAEVRSKGDAGVKALGLRFDGVAANSYRYDESALSAAWQSHLQRRHEPTRKIVVEQELHAGTGRRTSCRSRAAA